MFQSTHSAHRAHGPGQLLLSVRLCIPLQLQLQPFSLTFTTRRRCSCSSRDSCRVVSTADNTGQGVHGCRDSCSAVAQQQQQQSEEPPPPSPTHLLQLFLQNLLQVIHLPSVSITTSCHCCFFRSSHLDRGWCHCVSAAPVRGSALNDTALSWTNRVNGCDGSRSEIITNEDVNFV